MDSSNNESVPESARTESKMKEISINHNLAQFTMEDRMTVLERFIERVQSTVDSTNELNDK